MSHKGIISSLSRCYNNFIIQNAVPFTKHVAVYCCYLIDIFYGTGINNQLIKRVLRSDWLASERKLRQSHHSGRKEKQSYTNFVKYLSTKYHRIIFEISLMNQIFLKQTFSKWSNQQENKWKSGGKGVSRNFPWYRL